MSVLKAKIARAMAIHKDELPLDKNYYKAISLKAPTATFSFIQTNPFKDLSSEKIDDELATPFLANSNSKRSSQRKQKSKLSVKPEDTKMFITRSSSASTTYSESALPSSLEFAKNSTKSINSAKNIVKNYGRAFASFALSSLSEPYLPKFLDENFLSVDDFREFVTINKDSIDGISTLRDMLLIKKDNTEVVKRCKKVFMEVAVIFIKFFSVNWIFHSKVYNKDAHLKFRFKMLRRVKQPEFFTYLKGPEVFEERHPKSDRSKI